LELNAGRDLADDWGARGASATPVAWAVLSMLAAVLVTVTVMVVSQRRGLAILCRGGHPVGLL
jgi:hypothetical protein